MGNLVHAPFCEITATLEMFARFGVTPDDLATLRGLSPVEQGKRIAALLGIPTLHYTRPGRAVDVPARAHFCVAEHYTSKTGSVDLHVGDWFKRNMFAIHLEHLPETTIRLMTVTPEQYTIKTLCAEAGGPKRAEISLYEFYSVVEDKDARDDLRTVAAFVRSVTGVLTYTTARKIPDGWVISTCQIDDVVRNAAMEFQLMMRA